MRNPPFPHELQLLWFSFIVRIKSFSFFSGLKHLRFPKEAFKPFGMTNLYPPHTKFPSWPWLYIINTRDLYSDCLLFTKDEQNPCPTANPRSNCNHWTETSFEFPIIAAQLQESEKTLTALSKHQKKFHSCMDITHNPTGNKQIQDEKKNKKHRSTSFLALFFSWNRFPVISSAFYLEGTVRFQFCWCTVWYFLEAFVFKIALPVVKAFQWSKI